MQSAETITDANVRYHDLAAEHYDSKWGIKYDAVGQAQVTSKLAKALGHEPRRYARALEIGAGRFEPREAGRLIGSVEVAQLEQVAD